MKDLLELQNINHANQADDSELVEEPWFVYICESKAGHYYVGISPKPRRVLKNITMVMAQKWLGTKGISL